MSSFNIGNTRASLEQEAKRKGKVIAEQEAKRITLEIEHKIQQAKVEIFGMFQAYVLKEGLEYFLNMYGTNFDVSSFNASIIFKMGNDLYPDFSYNKSIFHFNSSIQRDKDKFNKNAKYDSSFDEYMDGPEFDTFEQEDLYYEDNPFDAAFNAIATNIDDSHLFNPHNKALQQGGFASLDETYVKMKIQVMAGFDALFYRRILPDIQRKYGITL